MADIQKESRIAVDVKEAVRLTCISRSMLYNLMLDGRLPKKKIGNRTLILVDDLRSLFSEQMP